MLSGKVYIYIDDAYMSCGSFEIARDIEFLKRLESVGLKLKPAKAKVMVHTLVYLGKRISPKGYNLTPNVLISMLP